MHACMLAYAPMESHALRLKNMLQEHKPALMATVDALSEHGEMLGGELRDIFDSHPPVGVSGL